MIAFLGFLLICVGIVSLASLPLILRDWVIQFRWRRAARVLGFDFKAGPLTGSDLIRGVIDGLPLSISNCRRRRTAVTLEARDSIPIGVQIRRRSLLARLVLDDSLSTGDDEFDAAVMVHGLPLDVFPRLEARTRNLLIELVASREIEVQGSLVRFHSSRLVQRAKILNRIAQDLTLVARSLAIGVPLEERLRINATSSWEPLRFRVTNLRLLSARFARSKEADMACRWAMRQEDQEERLAGALGLGADREALDCAAEIARNPTSILKLRTRAIEHLVQQSPLEQLEPELVALSASEREEIRAVALRGLASRRLPGARARLLALSADPSPAAAAAVAEGLGMIAERGDPEIEHVLIGMLSRSAFMVKRAAASALGVAGTLAAAAALYPFTRGILSDALLRQRARDAIAEIQKHHPGADGGRLSLADTGSIGALSLPSAEGRGELSVVERSDVNPR